MRRTRLVDARSLFVIVDETFHQEPPFRSISGADRHSDVRLWELAEHHMDVLAACEVETFAH